jgi:hypothetical protein
MVKYILFWKTLASLCTQNVFNPYFDTKIEVCICKNNPNPIMPELFDTKIWKTSAANRCFTWNKEIACIFECILIYIKNMLIILDQKTVVKPNLKKTHSTIQF